jgi:hypothetical protein
MRTALIASAVLAAAALPTTAAAQLGDSVLVSIAVPEAVRAGRPVPVRLSLTNRLGRPVTVRVASTRAPVWDVRVTAAGGRIVWNRLHAPSAGFTDGVLSLAPHATSTTTVTWDQRDTDGRPVAPGLYRVRGFLYARLPRGRMTESVPLRIR